MEQTTGRLSRNPDGKKHARCYNVHGLVSPPLNYKAAHVDPVTGAHAPQAETKQMDKLVNASSFEYVDLDFAVSRMQEVHDTTSLVRLHWIYALKPAELSARLVYPGNRFKYGSNGDVAATMLRWDTAKLMVLNGTHLDHEITTSDAGAAFMNKASSVEEYVYCPQGFNQPGRGIKILTMWYGKENAPEGCQDI